MIGRLTFAHEIFWRCLAISAERSEPRIWKLGAYQARLASAFWRYGKSLGPNRLGLFSCEAPDRHALAAVCVLAVSVISGIRVERINLNSSRGRAARPAPRTAANGGDLCQRTARVLLEDRAVRYQLR